MTVQRVHSLALPCGSSTPPPQHSVTVNNPLSSPITDSRCEPLVHLYYTSVLGALCVHKYGYVFMHICNIHTHMYVRICVHGCIDVFTTSMCRHVYVHVCTCTYTYMSHMILYRHVYLYVHARTCMYMYIHVCTCTYIYAFMYMYIHVCTYVCIYMCMYNVHTYVCVYT